MHLIDTSAWIDYFKPSGDPDVRENVRNLLELMQAGWCEMVLLELQGSPNSRQSMAISMLEPSIPLFTINQSCWNHAYELSRASKLEGCPVPNTDALIYATAVVHELKLTHNDKHFDWLDQITGHPIAERLSE